MSRRATEAQLTSLIPALRGSQAARKRSPRLTMEEIRESPERFFREMLGAEPYDAQIEMMNLLRDRRRIAVVGANATGKDWTAGRLIPWWLLSWEQAVAIVIGPTYRQVDDIVWRETRAGYRAAKVPLGGEMYETPRLAMSGSKFAIGFATDRPLNIMGFHSPHLLVIITEAHHVGQEYVEAVKRLNPERILLTGNALAAGGEFYDAFHSKGDIYATLQISAFDTPNVVTGREVIPGLVTIEDIEERKKEWGEESPMYLASMKGQFPDELEDVVVPRSLLVAAQARTLEVAEDVGATLSCDVARFGEDQTVVWHIRGGVCRPLWKVQGKDTQAVAGKLLAFAEDPALRTDVIVVDDTGVGGGVTDRLREEKRNGALPKIAIIAFNGGAKARRDDRHVNAVTEAWMSFAKACRDERVALTGDATAAVAQFSSRQREIQGDRRLRLESKDDYKKRVGRSPDDADALAMGFSPLAHRQVLRFT